MKPSIVYWAYLGLGFLLLDNILNIISVFQIKTYEKDAGFIGYPILQILIVLLSIAAIGGLVRRVSWARVASLVAIGAETFHMFGMSIYIFFSSKGEEVSLLMTSLLFGIPLLFLAYKLYSSKPLRIYLFKLHKES